MPEISAIAELVKLAAKDAGFDLAGIAAVCDFPELEYFPAWVANGHAGEMKYLESRNEAGQLKRASLHTAAPWARSVIVCAVTTTPVTHIPHRSVTRIGDGSRVMPGTARTTTNR